MNMEKDFMRSESIIELEFITGRETEIHYHENFEMLYVVNGTADISVEEECWKLQPEDMIIINASRNHSFVGSEDMLLARFSLSYLKIKTLLGQNTVLFWCNSSAEKHEAFEDLRRIIVKIFYQFQQKENGEIYLYSLYYQMLHLLTSNFLLMKKDERYIDEVSRNNNRMQDIFAYIRANYQSTITLQNLADHLYLSTTYLSKYIKKTCGLSFVELLNSVRLGHAMEELMYTNVSVMKIAMDNGFANVGAYNKAFKDAYQMTPSEFRKKIVIKKKDTDKKEQVEYLKVQETLERYLEKTPMIEEKIESNELQWNVDALTSYPASKKGSFNKMINAGTAFDLTKSVFQEQILQAKKKLGFTYVRFWDIYEAELYLNIHEENLYFGQLDVILDFLMKNGLKPYMELGFKPIRLLKNVKNAVKEISRDLEFESLDEMKRFYYNLMRHFLKRYGPEEVATWYFEYWEKEDTKFRNLEYGFAPMSKEGHENYFNKFDVLAEAFRMCLPEVRIGGAGFPLQHYREEGFYTILRAWKQHKETPDFISLTSYPYSQEKEGDVYYEKKSTDSEFMLHNIEIAQKVMEEVGFSDKELHISEYGLSLSNRNIVNDSCIKGAYLIKNAMSCMEKADCFGHWIFTDAYANYQDTQELLFGGCGLVAKNGILKPAFYALQFLNRLYGNVVFRHANGIITTNRRGSYRIVCHNFKNLNLNYYMTGEDEIKIENLPHMIENRSGLTIHIKLDHMAKNIYTVKSSIINQEYGSIQDEWNELNRTSDLSMEEQEYLEKTCTPKLLIKEMTVNRGTLQMDLFLKPNEFQIIYVM